MQANMLNWDTLKTCKKAAKAEIKNFIVEQLEHLWFGSHAKGDRK